MTPIGIVQGGPNYIVYLKSQKTDLVQIRKKAVKLKEVLMIIIFLLLINSVKIKTILGEYSMSVML